MGLLSQPAIMQIKIDNVHRHTNFRTSIKRIRRYPNFFLNLNNIFSIGYLFRVGQFKKFSASANTLH